MQFGQLEANGEMSFIFCIILIITIAKVPLGMSNSTTGEEEELDFFDNFSGKALYRSAKPMFPTRHQQSGHF
jgi:hypothetical protein